MDTEEFISTGVVFPGGKIGCGSDLRATRQSETSADVGTEMTNTSWGQVQSGLSWQEILLLSKERSHRTQGESSLSSEVLLMS